MTSRGGCGKRAAKRVGRRRSFALSRLSRTFVSTRRQGFKPDDRVNSCDWTRSRRDWPGCGIRRHHAIRYFGRGELSSRVTVYPRRFKCTQTLSGGLAIAAPRRRCASWASRAALRPRPSSTRPLFPFDIISGSRRGMSFDGTVEAWCFEAATPAIAFPCR